MAQSLTWKVGDSKSIIHRFTEEEVNLFSDLTGDKNPLHVDPDYGRRSQAGGPVVHGMLAASFISTLIGMHLPGPGALWQAFQINWKKMIRIGETVRFEVNVTEVHESVRTLVLGITGFSESNREICLEGSAKVMILSRQENSNPLLLKGKRILVTGASGELGSAICAVLAGRGARLILWGRDEKRLGETASKLNGQLDSRSKIDLFDMGAIESGLKQILTKDEVFGFVHVAAPPLSFVSVEDPRNQDLLEAQWKINVTAFNKIVQALVPSMKSGGSIVHILTQSVFDVPPAKLSAYVAAKSAAWALIKAMALELGPKGIRANAISPGMMNTPYSKDFPVRTKQVEEAANPLRRLCAVENVAEAAAFLCSPEASFINGINLPVTGGARMP